MSIQKLNCVGWDFNNWLNSLNLSSEVFNHKSAKNVLVYRDEPILLFFLPIFLSGNSFIFNLFFQIFCLKFIILLKRNKHVHSYM